VARWRARLAAEKSRLKPTKPSSAANDLKRRVAIEQAARSSVPDRASSRLSANDWEAANKAIWDDIGKIDSQNTLYLKSILPADSWFRFNRDGKQVALDAWLIVQHSPDRKFQRRVLGLMAPLLATGDASGTDYALLYDRVAIFEGKLQRYGSQITCVNGHFEPSAVENPVKLDELRASVGLKTIAEYLRHWDGKSC
jgi:hypothetical protein